MEDVTPGKSKAPMVAVVVIVLIIAIGVWFRMGGGTATPSVSPTDDMSAMPSASISIAPSSSLSPSKSPSASSTVSSQVKSFTITGQNFSFDPSSITVKKGDTVKITFKNASGFHDLRIEGYDLKTPMIQGGKTADITFVADKAGQFVYYCSVGNHRAMGMQGTLIVQ